MKGQGEMKHLGDKQSSGFFITNAKAEFKQSS